MKKLTLIFALLLSIMTTYGQSYQVVPNESDVSITGTSTIHDWESEVEKFEGTAELSLEDGELTSISDLEFSATVKSIKSGKGAMDKKIYGALKEGKHPEIIFKATEIHEFKDDSVHAVGELTVAGVTNTIQLTAAYEIQEDGTVVFSGNHPLKMKDFDVNPPSAMFGSVKSGNEIVVHFKAKFVQANNS